MYVRNILTEIFTYNLKYVSNKNIFSFLKKFMSNVLSNIYLYYVTVILKYKSIAVFCKTYKKYILFNLFII